MQSEIHRTLIEQGCPKKDMLWEAAIGPDGRPRKARAGDMRPGDIAVTRPIGQKSFFVDVTAKGVPGSLPAELTLAHSNFAAKLADSDKAKEAGPRRVVQLVQTMVRLSFSYLGTPSKAARAGCAVLGKAYPGGFDGTRSTQNTGVLGMQRVSLACMAAFARNIVATMTDDADNDGPGERGEDFAAADHIFRDNLLAIGLHEADDDLGPMFRRQLAFDPAVDPSDECRRPPLPRPPSLLPSRSTRPHSRRVATLRQSDRSLLYHAVAWRALNPVLDAGTRGAVMPWSAPADRWLSRLLTLVYPGESADAIQSVMKYSVLPSVVGRCRAALQGINPAHQLTGDVLEYNVSRLAAGFVGKVVNIGLLIGKLFVRNQNGRQGDAELFHVLERGESIIQSLDTWNALAQEDGADIMHHLQSAPAALPWPSRVESPPNQPQAARVLPVGTAGPWNRECVTTHLRNAASGQPTASPRRRVAVIHAFAVDPVATSPALINPAAPRPGDSAEAGVRAKAGTANPPTTRATHTHQVPPDFLPQLQRDEAAARVAQASAIGTNAGESLNQRTPPGFHHGAVTGAAPRPQGASAAEQLERTLAEESATEQPSRRSITTNAPRAGPARTQASIQQTDPVGTCCVVAGTRRSAGVNATDDSGG